MPPIRPYSWTLWETADRAASRPHLGQDGVHNVEGVRVGEDGLQLRPEIVLIIQRGFLVGELHRQRIIVDGVRGRKQLIAVGVQNKDANLGQRAWSIVEISVREALIKSGFEGDGLQAVRKYRKIIAALAAEGLRRSLIGISFEVRASGCMVTKAQRSQTIRRFGGHTKCPEGAGAGRNP